MEYKHSELSDENLKEELQELQGLEVIYHDVVREAQIRHELACIAFEMIWRKNERQLGLINQAD